MKLFAAYLYSIRNDTLFKIFISFILASILLFYPVSAHAESPDAFSKVSLSIVTPSDMETTIASGRNFYVLGDIEGGEAVPADAKLTVTLLDKNGTSVRETVTAIKNNTDLNTSYNQLSYYDTSDPERLNIKASGMPELINSGNFNDATTKCYYSDNQFHALIVGGSNKDQMNFVDENGKPYTALSEGDYTINATLSDNTGESIASDTKAITIGVTPDKVLARFSPDDHFNFITEWASENGFRVYSDPFPGYWSQDELFCEILPEWRAADAAEYSAGKVHCVLYNMKPTSSSYSVELGALQDQGVIDDKDRMVYYYYDLGEPQLDEQKANLVALPNKQKTAFTRAEIIKGDVKDNIYDMKDNAQVISKDFNVSDGVSAASGETIAFYGVTAPIQLAPEDIVDKGDNSYMLTNKITTLRYTMTGDGINVTTDKPVALERIDSDGWSNPSELEFKHSLAIDDTMTGKNLNISVAGYDKYGQAVRGTEQSFSVNVKSTVIPGEKEEGSQPVTPASKDNPKTSTADLEAAALAAILLSAALSAVFLNLSHKNY